MSTAVPRFRGRRSTAGGCRARRKLTLRLPLLVAAVASRTRSRAPRKTPSVSRKDSRPADAAVT